MEEKAPTNKLKTWVWVALALAAGAAAVTALVAILVRRKPQKPAPQPLKETQPIGPGVHVSLHGLSEEEAAKRRQEGQDNVILFKPPHSPKQILRENALTIFNLNLIGLAAVQLLIQRPVDALLSLGTLLLNIGIGVFQELFARRRLKDLEQATRPQATVIRGDSIRSIDPSEIVLGDLVVAGPGDDILVDGEIAGDGAMIVDESMLTHQDSLQIKGAGDSVLAGSFCISGRAAYEAKAVGSERLVVKKLVQTQAGKTELTPIEGIIRRIMIILSGIVFAMTVILLLGYFHLDTGIPATAFSEAASVIFNIAPASLFLMVVLTYAPATADLARFGALVHQARSIESMAEINVLCLAQMGILSGTQIELEPLQQPTRPEHPQGNLAEARIRQILGDFAQSCSVQNQLTRVMQNTFAGNRREAGDEAPYLSVYGWSALAFSDEDLHGLYVLGEPDALQGHLLQAAAAPEAEPAEEQPPKRNPIAILRRLFKRKGSKAETVEPAPADQLDPAILPGGGEPEEENMEAPITKADNPTPSLDLSMDLLESPTGDGSGAAKEDANPEHPEAPKMGFIQRLKAKFGGALKQMMPVTAAPEIPEEAPQQESVLLFAYQPEYVSLQARGGEPQLPGDLIPLCKLRFIEKIRPEAIEIIQTFVENGVGIKVFTPDAPDMAIAALKQASVETKGEELLHAISGAELAELSPEQLSEAALTNTIFSQVTPDLTASVVKVLRAQSYSVAVFGDSPIDVPAMRQANLAVARQRSTPAALSVADIVLLAESPRALVYVLDKGQRIANGLLNVLKLYITQSVYVAALVVVTMVFFHGFPYRSAQATIVAILTLTLPSVVFTIWSTGGVLKTHHLHHMLDRFFVPAAATITAAGVVVYGYFRDQTGQTSYAQLTLTYALVGMGLLLSVFVKPPPLFRRKNQALPTDWIPTGLALLGGLAFWLMTQIPIAQKSFYLGPLNSPSDYGFIGLVVLVWGIFLQLVWRML